MEARPRTRFDARGLVLADGTALDLFAGSMHYWRVPRASWDACLDGIAALGLRIVTTYVPWGVHEERKGKLDFHGDRDLGAFLDAIAARGMHAIVRPGPHINAELTCFGFPEWLLADEAVQARSARDTPVWLPAPPKMFPVPSYAATPFRDATARWLAAVGEVVGPRRWPDGPVVALQVDNEMQHFFRLGAYDHDYHPEALAWWREDEGDVEPPRRWDAADAERCVRWVAHKDRYTERALSWLCDAVDDAGLGDIARFHNAPPSDPRLTCVPAMERVVGAAGLDFYHPAAHYARARERALYLSGSTTLPLAPELGIGGPPWLPPMTAADQQSVTLGVLAGGVRALNFYMLVDRDRWYGAALDQNGTEQAAAPFVRELVATLREVGWTGLRRPAAIAVVVSRAESRFGVASSQIDPFTPIITELLDFGPGGHASLAADPAPGLHRRWERAVADALELAEIPYLLIDEDALDRVPEGVRAVVLPTLDRVDGRAWTALHLLADAGVAVVIGPQRPSRDELDRPLGDDAALPARCGVLRPESLDDIGGLAEDLLGLAGDLGDDWIAPDHPAVHVTPFADDGGAVRAVTVGNASAEATVARVAVARGATLGDPLGGAAIRAGRGVAEIPLAPFEVRLFSVG